jgi:hypothetical protein
MLARVVTARSPELAAMLGTSSEALLTEFYGGSAAAWSLAGRSLLSSGFFAEAAAAFSEATRLGGTRPGDARHLHFAEGMAAYLAGRYSEAVARLSEWFASTTPHATASDRPLARQAAAALSRVGTLAGTGSTEATEAARCLERLNVLDPESFPSMEILRSRRSSAAGR